MRTGRRALGATVCCCLAPAAMPDRKRPSLDVDRWCRGVDWLPRFRRSSMAQFFPCLLSARCARIRLRARSGKALRARSFWPPSYPTLTQLEVPNCFYLHDLKAHSSTSSRSDLYWVRAKTRAIPVLPRSAASGTGLSGLAQFSSATRRENLQFLANVRSRIQITVQS